MHFEAAAKLASLLVGKIAAGSLPQDVLLNINLPNLPLDKIEGIELTKLARRNYADLVKEGHDGKRKYYWIARGEPQWDGDEGTDISAIERGRISITPLRNELSTAWEIPFVEGLCSSLFQELR